MTEVPPSPLTLCRPLTADECGAGSVQRQVVFNLYVANTVPFDLALLLVILTKTAECGLCSLLSKVTHMSHHCSLDL